MTRPVVWVTRTADGAGTTARAVEAKGYEAICASVLKVVPLTPEIDPQSFDTVIFTSRNAVKAFCAVCARRTVAAYCVGDATAEAATDARFHTMVNAHGDIDALYALLQKEADRARRLLYAAPKAPAAPLTQWLRADGFQVNEVAVYETCEVEPVLPAADLARLTHVLIHSARAGKAAAQFLMTHHNKIAFKNLTFVCISEAAWQAVRGTLAAEGSADVPLHRIADFPDEAAMLQRLEA